MSKSTIQKIIEGLQEYDGEYFEDENIPLEADPDYEAWINSQPEVEPTVHLFDIADMFTDIEAADESYITERQWEIPHVHFVHFVHFDENEQGNLPIWISAGRNFNPALHHDYWFNENRPSIF